MALPTCRAARACSSFLLPYPVFGGVRFYNKATHLRQKRLKKKMANQDDVTFAEAMDVMRTYCLREDRTVSAHIACKKPEEGAKPTRGDLLLPVPMSTDTSSIVLVFAKGAAAEEAKRLGAHHVGAEELIALVAAGKVNFDRCLATKEMFPQVVKIAKVLGPKGLMPSPARGTVSDDIPAMMSVMQATSKYEMDEELMIHMPIAQTAWPTERILANLKALAQSVINARPAKTDASTFIEGIYVSAPFAPGIKLPLAPFRDLFSKKK